ncbi:MAG: AAA family ATPase, partial [Treponema sp.]|nr:AAA family ATPase [Treponema sp.]
RGAGYGGGHDEREQTLNQLLVEMDGFDSKDGVIILAATNRPDVLDPALLRPGRFDRQVVVAMPDIKEREDILKIHSAKIPLDKEVDLVRVARATPGMSGADIANLVNEAALFAARKDKGHVEMSDFEEARDKILMGVARKTLVISDRERRMTAIHEAGHALLHYYLKHSDPLHKVTIVPHGRALGMAMSLPEEDSYSRTRGWILDRIVICYGGWAAELLFYSETTTGTKQDLEQATDMARRMVCEWGMADELGPVTYGQEDEPIFLGKEIARHKDYSEETARRIDNAIKRILDEARIEAEEILKTHKQELEKLADALLVRETLVDDEIRTLLGFPPRNDIASLVDHQHPAQRLESRPAESPGPEKSSDSVKSSDSGRK